MKQFLFLILLFSSLGISAQRINTSFGKNRVQFHNDYDEWRKYQSDHFTSYWYGRAKNIANSVVDIAEEEYDEIRKLMEYRLNDKIELFIFTDLTDMKQSNIGSEEIFVGVNDETTVIGNKVLLYFDGNHKHLYKNIRSGIAEVFIYQMFNSSNLKDFVKSKFSSRIPDWYNKGLVSYIGSKWDSKTENDLARITKSNTGKWDFHKWSNKYPKEIGHSFWYFIDQNYGRSTISNILYLTRIYRNMNEAFIFELGQELDVTLVDWKNYYIDKLQYFQYDINKNNTIYKSKKNEQISFLKLSPNRSKLLYCKNRNGKYKLIIHNLKSNDTKIIFKLGYRNLLQETDYNYPLATWNNEEEISFIYEKRDIIYLRRMNVITGDYKEQELPRSIQRIYSISAINELEYVIAASKNGFSELYIYNAKKRQFTTLTSGKYDNLEAIYINDDSLNGILYTSTSTDEKPEIINNKTWKFNISFMDFSVSDKPIKKLGDFDFSDHYELKYLGNSKIGFLSKKSGYAQQYIYDINSDLTMLISPDISSVKKYDIDYNRNTNYKVIKDNNREYIIKESNQSWTNHTASNSYFVSHTNISEKEIEHEKKEIPEGLLFVTKFEEPKRNTKSNYNNSSKKEKKHKFNIDRITGARLAFSLADYSFNFSNDILFEGLETYIENQNSGQFLNNNGFLLKAITKDLFENYNIEAGIRIPTRLNGNEVYLLVKDDKRLIDREYILYRKSKKYTLEEGFFGEIQQTRKIGLLGMIRWKYPFDIYKSIRLSTSYNIERYAYLGVDDRRYDDPVVNDKRLAIKLEYIFDNTIVKDLNILHGTRYKFYAEAINKFDIQIFDNPTFELNKGHSFVFGLDARNYFPLGQHALFASRIAVFTSLGSEKILYQLGGIENWINPSFSINNTNTEGERFSYRYNVANLRGFKSNVRNGNSAALSSLEFRFLPFRYLSKKRIQSSFFRNFQVVLFGDIGTAWYGLNPFDDKRLNEIHISQPPIFEIDVIYHRDPIVIGYGLGIRATILGTLLRVDYGWGLESGITQKPILYLGLGKDF